MKTTTIVHEAAKIPGWMTKKELTWLVEKAKSQFKWSSWVELGSYCGRSLLAVGLALPAGASLISVDANWQNRKDCDTNLFDVLQRLDRERRGEITLQAVRATTDEACGLFYGNHFSVVFIDANHSYQFCRNDIQKWLHLLERYGTICGHDYCDAWPGVQKAVDELLPNRQLTETIWHCQLSDQRNNDQ